MFRFRASFGHLQRDLRYFVGEFGCGAEQRFEDYSCSLSEMRTLGQLRLCLFDESNRQCARFPPTWHLKRHVSQPQDARFGGIAERMRRDILGMTAQNAQCRVPIDCQREAEPGGELIFVDFPQQRDAPIRY